MDVQWGQMDQFFRLQFWKELIINQKKIILSVNYDYVQKQRADELAADVIGIFKLNFEILEDLFEYKEYSKIHYFCLMLNFNLEMAKKTYLVIEPKGLSLSSQGATKVSMPPSSISQDKK